MGTALALGFQDEVWWSRLAQPTKQHGVEAKAVTRLQELMRAKGDPDPKAPTCDGRLVRCPPQRVEQMPLRFVTWRPISAVTIDCLA
jgi:hypothetical protein